MRRLISDVRSLDCERPEGNSRQLTHRIQAALHREARLQASYSRQRADWIELWRTRLFSQGVGAVVSMAMFVVMAAGVLRPAYRALALAQAVTQVMLEESGSDEIRLKLLLFAPAPPPVFNPSGELLGIGASMSEGDEIMASVRVTRDGKASIDRIFVPSRDPAIVNRFSDVINQRASFQPIRRNQNASAEAIVIFSKVTVSD